MNRGDRGAFSFRLLINPTAKEQRPMPAWQQLLETTFEYAEDVWAKILAGVILAAVGWWLGKRRATKQWAKREFLDRLNVSLNLIEDGVLKIRTLLEKPSEEVFLNKLAIGNVREAADKTTEADPILPFPADDRWYYLNAVLNEIAEHFADGPLRADLGHPVRREWYLICLTNERAGAVRTHKVRAMVIKESLLKNLPDKCPKLEAESHKTRWETLNTLAKAYEADATQFLRIEICL